MHHAHHGHGKRCRWHAAQCTGQPDGAVLGHRVAGGGVDDDAGAAQHVAVLEQGIAQAAQAVGKPGLQFVQLGRLQHAVLPERDGIDIFCRVESVVNGGGHGFNQKGRQKGSTYS